MARKKDDQPPDLREIASRRTARDKARAKAAGEARKEDRLFERFMSGRVSVDPVRGRMGARVCQICVRIATYSTATVPAPLRVGPFEDFVCPLCQSGPVPEGQPRDRQAAERWAEAALAAQLHRFCEGCQARVERAEGRRHRGLWLCEACMKSAWAKKATLARLLGQRFLDAGVGSDDLLWNRNVTLQPAPPDRQETEPRGAAGGPAANPA